MLKQPRLLLVALLVLLVAATISCKRDDSNRQASGRGDADQALAARVQAKFYNTPSIRESSVKVTTKDGVVRLEGSVPSDNVKNEAVQTAQGIEGVRKVDDRLAVASGTTAQPGGQGQSPTGTQASQGSHPAPSEGATPEERLHDGWITVKVQSKYFSDPAVKGRAVNVNTASGVVTLAGDVDTEETRQRAVQLAQEVEGVRQVDDRLRVTAETPTGTSGRTEAAPAVPSSPGATPQPTTPAPQPTTPAPVPAPTPAPGTTASTAAVPDTEITTLIQSRYFESDVLRPSAVTVETRDGIVRLSGSVATEVQRQQAIEVAESVEGVRRVEDHLEVRPPSRTVGTVGSLPSADPAAAARPTDELIAASVQAKYFVSDAVKTSDIRVSAREGVVTLTGRADTDEAKRQAEEIARRVEGVTQVVNRIQVK